MTVMAVRDLEVRVGDLHGPCRRMRPVCFDLKHCKHTVC